MYGMPSNEGLTLRDKEWGFDTPLAFNAIKPLTMNVLGARGRWVHHNFVAMFMNSFV